MTRRYPGVRPFDTAEQDRFFGREQDLRDLGDLILIEKLMVLFGTSGYGKSSLINAGIIPRFTEAALDESERYQPLLVRMRNYDPSENTPVQKVVQELETVGQGDPHPISAQIDALWQANGWPETLWYQLRRYPEQRYLLIFDQFEEFFTYPAEQQLRFREELAELLYTGIPQGLRKVWRSLDPEIKAYLSQPLEVRSLFAIRQDKLSLLDSMTEELPAILSKRYLLKGLTRRQAEAAIIQPAMLPQKEDGTAQEERFDSPSFSYTENTQARLLDELSQAGRVEAFLLQICCEHIERGVLRRIAAGESGPISITLADLPDFNDLYDAYYTGKIEELPLVDRPAARKLIEEGLLFYDPLRDEARRISVDRDQLIATYGIQADLLAQLKNMFLIRETNNSVGGFSYEISHDTLIAPILRAREARLAVEARRKARKRLIRSGAVGLLSIGIAVAAIWFGIWARGQQQEAITQRNEAERLAEESQAKTEELQQTLSSLQAQVFTTDSLTFEQSASNLDAYARAQLPVLMQEEFQQMQAIVDKHADTLILARRLQDLRQRYE